MFTYLWLLIQHIKKTSRCVLIVAETFLCISASTHFTKAEAFQPISAFCGLTQSDVRKKLECKQQTHSHTQPNTNASVCECMRRRQIRVGTAPKREVTRSGASLVIRARAGVRACSRPFRRSMRMHANPFRSSARDATAPMPSSPSLRSRQRCPPLTAAPPTLTTSCMRVTLSLYWREMIRRDADARTFYAYSSGFMKRESIQGRHAVCVSLFGPRHIAFLDWATKNWTQLAKCRAPDRQHLFVFIAQLFATSLWR